MYGSLLPNPVLMVVNYFSVLLALALYAIVFGKFAKAVRIFG